MANRKLTLAEWFAEGQQRFGENKLDWKFVCPSCGHVASVKDYVTAEARPGEIAYSCIGRALGSKKQIFDKTGGPCNYAGGGLFRLNPVTVEFDDGTEGNYFEFAGALHAE